MTDQELKLLNDWSKRMTDYKYQNGSTYMKVEDTPIVMDYQSDHRGMTLPTDWSAASLTIDATEYPMLQAFTPDRKPVLTIHHDGRIEVSEDASPTETARQVLEAMQGMVQEMLRQEWNRAIDAAAKVCEPYCYLGPDAIVLAEEVQRLKK